MGTSACKYFQNNGLARVRPHAVSQLISTPPRILLINLISIFYAHVQALCGCLDVGVYTFGSHKWTNRFGL